MEDTTKTQEQMIAQQQVNQFHMSVFLSALNGLLSHHGAENPADEGKIVASARSIADEARRQISQPPTQ